MSLARNSLKKYHAKLFKNLSKLLTNKDFISNYTFKKSSFTRDRELSFKDVVLLILRLLKCSVRTELKTYFSTLFPSDLVVNWVSDAAFCKARQKIKAKFFQDLSEFITQYFYRTTKAEQWFGYRLLAVDGSCLNLPSSKELLEEFKEHHTNSIGTKIPMATYKYIK